MESNIDIIHINHNSRGTEGLYEDGIFQSLKNRFNQIMIVNAQYPIDYGWKLFYKISYKLGIPQKLFIFNIVKYIELCVDWFVIYIYIYRKRPKVVNHSLISRFMWPERTFLKMLCRLKGVKVILTCHDVIPFGDNVEKVIKNRSAIINIVDYLLVHNEGSRQDLINTFNVNPSKILCHPFPLMDTSKLFPYKGKTNDIDFLFIGYIRKEKGVHVLLKAWEIFHDKYPHAKLLIAGALADDNIDTQRYSDKNVSFILRFLDPEEYTQYLYRSKYVVLPYIKGTNSGILYSALPAGCDIIASDISMFKTDPIVSDNYIFKSGNVECLERILEKAYTEFKSETKHHYNEYSELVRTEMNSVYSSIIGY